MRQTRIWPNGLRYLWTDAFGVVLLLSLWQELHDERLLRECEWAVAEVERVLGRPTGIRLGAVDPRYRDKAIALVRDIHPAFVVPGRGVHWKMREDLSGAYPGFGFGALDAFHGLVVYRLLDPDGLAPQIAEMRALVEATYRALGMMLWLSHFFPDEPWAVAQRTRALRVLDRMWVDPPGSYRAGHEYDLDAITHVMACTSHFPGRLVRLAGTRG